MTICNTGPAVKMPGGKMLQTGDTSMPLELWQSFGADPALVEAVAAGVISAVHRTHEFSDGDLHCVGCSVTREEAEEERKARMPKKAAAEGTTASASLLTPAVLPAT